MNVIVLKTFVCFKNPMETLSYDILFHKKMLKLNY